MKPYDARQVANWFIRRAARDGRVLPVSFIMQLVYIAHARHMRTREAILFANKIEAWRSGIFIEDVYDTFRKQEEEVSRPAKGFAEIEEPSSVKFLEEVWETYKDRGLKELIRMTEDVNTPWYLAAKIGGWYAQIPPALIKLHQDALAYQLARRND